MRSASIPLVALAVLALAVALSAVPSTATAAPARPCGLPGYVTRDPGRPCPPVPRARPQPQWSPISPITHLFGKALKLLGLATIVSWVVHGAADALRATAGLVGSSTRPDLSASWFSASYWRVAAVSSLLTVPFLFAAAIHALVRSDIALLGRAAFGYLPIALIGVGIAAPITTMLLSATDEMSSIVASASSHSDSVFLGHAALTITASSVVDGNPFLAFICGVLTVMATMALWVELLIRDAAVYVIVLMLPLFFAAMVWPARRAWAVRAVEVLFALILAKFAIVCVLALGGAAISNSPASGPTSLLTGVTLVLLATMAPWALLRLLPIHEVAAAAAGSLSQPLRGAVGSGFSTAVGAHGALRSSGGEPDALDRVDDEPAMHALAQSPSDSDGGRVLGRGPGSGEGRSGASQNGSPTRSGENDAGLAAIAGAGLGNGAAAASAPRRSPEEILGIEDPGSGERGPLTGPLAADNGTWDYVLDDASPPVIAGDGGAAGPVVSADGSGGVDDGPRSAPSPSVDTASAVAADPSPARDAGPAPDVTAPPAVAPPAVAPSVAPPSSDPASVPGSTTPRAPSSRDADPAPVIDPPPVADPLPTTDPRPLQAPDDPAGGRRRSP